MRCGQVEVAAGMEYWILNFDGVSDLELGEFRDQNHIEYSYSLMTKAADISTSECRMLNAQGRAHFMSKRFDRTLRIIRPHGGSTSLR